MTILLLQTVHSRPGDNDNDSNDDVPPACLILSTGSTVYMYVFDQPSLLLLVVFFCCFRRGLVSAVLALRGR